MHVYSYSYILYLDLQMTLTLTHLFNKLDKTNILDTFFFSILHSSLLKYLVFRPLNSVFKAYKTTSLYSIVQGVQCSRYWITIISIASLTVIISTVVIRKILGYYSIDFSIVKAKFPYFRNLKFVRVSSLIDRYLYNVYIVKMCFTFMSRTIKYVHVYILLDFPASVLCQSEFACLHKTVNMVVFFVKSNENTYPKGRALMQIYRVVPKTKKKTMVESAVCM